MVGGGFGNRQLDYNKWILIWTAVNCIRKSQTHGPTKRWGFGTAVDQRITSGMSNVVDLQNEGSYLRVAQVSIHQLNAKASTCAGF